MAEATRTTPEATRTPYIGLARLYRPQTFADLVGQDQIGRTLAQQVQPDEHGNPQVAQACARMPPASRWMAGEASISARLVVAPIRQALPLRRM